MDKLEDTWGNTKYSEEENDFLRRCSNVLGMKDSQVVRKCLAVGLTQLMFNPYCRRVELEDVINGMRESVDKLWNARNTRR